MRIAALTLFAAAGIAAVATAASAAPLAPVPAAPTAANLVPVAGGCGWRLHRNRWGYCVPNRQVYYAPRPYYRQRYWPGYYGGDGYEPWNRPSPTDHVANQLNRQQRYYGY